MASKKLKAFFSRQTIFQSLFFIAAVLLTLYFFPREGKPWRYGLLTASFDFPIYKSSIQIKTEQDSVLKDFQPFYTFNPNIATKQSESLQIAYKTSLKSKLPTYLYNLLQKEIQEVYQQGIVSSNDYERLQKEKITAIRVLENNVSKTYLMSSLLSPRMAYEKIIENLPDEGSRSLVHDCNLNNYLVENLSFDAGTTQKAKDELLQRINIIWCSTSRRKNHR